MRKAAFGWAVLLVVVVVTSVTATAYYLEPSTADRVIVSTTTSLYDTGLLDAIEATFEAKNPIDLNFISVGTGIAIQHARRGDADLILVHSPRDELGFLKDGTGLNRKIIAYNFFAIVGPEDDPAKIRSMLPAEALTKIVETGRNGTETLWVSRGDNSGTHSKETSLWTAAGFDSATLTQEGWFASAGSGMGETLKKADYFGAYTLADMGTYMKYVKDDLISSVTLVGQAEDLLNVYSAVVVNQTLHPRVNFDGALSFVKFLVSDEGQQMIEQFGRATYGQSLFHPAVGLLKTNADPPLAQMIRDYAFFNSTECPPEYRRGYPELYD
ncbi:MAG: substrate-binding domain-containing protein [Candidatus Bathyarchaeota archaeon]|nr:MAG: substrate-binding domain-containing protein [Candidatus Bathyarchaeota archaeon]